MYVTLFLGDRMPIENLRPSTTYIFQVQARNEVNLGQPDQLVVTTGDVGELFTSGDVIEFF